MIGMNIILKSRPQKLNLDNVGYNITLTLDGAMRLRTFPYRIANLHYNEVHMFNLWVENVTQFNSINVNLLRLN